jgi:TM2 domain-containing membrane protein YozV
MQGGYGPPPGNPYGAGGYGPPPQQQPYAYGMAPVPMPGAYANAPYGMHPNGSPYSDKQKVVAGLLQIFLGKFGAGRFYTGHTGVAVGQLIACILGIWVFSWFTCGASIAVLLWPLIDGIVLLASDSRDAQGRMLR